MPVTSAMMRWRRIRLSQLGLVSLFRFFVVFACVFCLYQIINQARVRTVSRLLTLTANVMLTFILPKEF